MSVQGIEEVYKVGRRVHGWVGVYRNRGRVQGVRGVDGWMSVQVVIPVVELISVHNIVIS